VQEVENFLKKKICYYKERDEEKRKQFIEEMEKTAPEDRVYVDESGINKHLCREHARSLRGVPVYGSISGLKFARESFIAAKRGSQILAPLCYSGTCNTKLFNVWLRDFLLPELKPGQLVILDNASFHKSHQSRKLVEQAGCKVLFLPPYSPDLNPIEVFWANFKKLVRSKLEQIQSLVQAIDASFLEQTEVL
jgi:transposase